MNLLRIRYLCVIVITVIMFTTTTHADTMTFKQLLQGVVDHYPSLKTASLQVEKARQKNAQIESQLGWQLNSQGGYSKDVSFLGTAVRRAALGAGVSKKLRSGGTLSLDASILWEDSDVAYSPKIANPATITTIDLSYRKPLKKGVDNLDYLLGIKQADANVSVERSNRQALYDRLAAQVADIYLAGLVTKSRTQNLNQSLARTQRLQKFIKGRLKLGIAENKDQLQVVAQFRSQQAQLKALDLAWVQQQIALNRLMGRPADNSLALPETHADYSPQGTFDELINQVKDYSPVIHRLRKQIQIAEYAIRKAKDQQKDDLDMVMFVGNRAYQGESDDGSSADVSEVVGGVRLEYRYGVDQRGLRAAIQEARLNKDIALQDQRQVLEDLNYKLASLLAEMEALRRSLDAYRLSIESERAKLQEADQRYRRGRIDIDLVIQFESQLAAAELAYSLQKIELDRRLFKLSELRGQIWDGINVPELDLKALQTKTGDSS